jgi:hypothetical protein
MIKIKQHTNCKWNIFKAKIVCLNYYYYYFRSKQDIGKDVCGRYPGFHYWEHTDPRLIVCETFLQHNTSNSAYIANSYSDTSKQSENEPVRRN